MPTILADTDFLELLASRMEGLVYVVEHLHGPRVLSTFPLLDLASQRSLCQSLEADYQQWLQLTEVMVALGKDLSQQLRQAIFRFEEIEWDPIPFRQPGKAACETTGDASRSLQERMAQ